MRDGASLIRIIDAVEPTLVQMGRVNLRPGANRYKMVENCNYAVALGRALDFHLVNVAGLDIVDGSRKLTLAFLWQLMRHATLKTLSRVAFDGFSTDEGEVLKWANARAGATAAATAEPGAPAVAGRVAHVARGAAAAAAARDEHRIADEG